jgi:hypothetical protein
MRILSVATISIGLLAVPALTPAASADTMKYCAASWKGLSAAERAKTTNKAYLSSCLKGGPAVPPSPAAMMGSPTKPMAVAVPTKATAGVPAGAIGVQ